MVGWTPARRWAAQSNLPERLKISGKDRQYLPVYGYQAVTLLTNSGKLQLAANTESLDKLAEAVASGPAQPAS